MRTGAGYDVIVVGAGHNGLVAAAYLARAGRSVLAVERRPVIGGVAVTEEFHPGFRSSPLSPVCGPLLPPISKELDLARTGLALLPVDPLVVTPGEHGPLSVWANVAKTQAELKGISASDAERWPRFQASLLTMAEFLRPLLLVPPPEPRADTLPEGLHLLNLGRRLRRLGKEVMHQALRLPALSAWDYLGEWFESEPLKAILAAEALQGLFQGPRSPGTAFGLVRYHMALLDGGSWSFVRGGTGSLATALAKAAEHFGAEVRTGTEVRHILTGQGRAEGVELTTGEVIPCQAVASSADPKRTFLQLLGSTELEPGFLRGVRNLDTEGSVSVVDVALDGRPELRSVQGPIPWPPHLRLAPGLEYLERAYDEGKYGNISQHPALDAYMPSIIDPSLAPAGQQVMTVHVQYTPYHLRKGTWAEGREEVGDRVVELLGHHAPDLKSRVLHKRVLTPPDLEKTYGLTGGHIHHGEMTLNQAFFLRPLPGWSRYRTPIRGLYLCGSGAHPGGGITGGPGHNAARVILRDLPRARA